MSLFPEIEKMNVTNGWIIFIENFLSQQEADVYFQELKANLIWQSSDIKIFGKTYQTPRLEAFYSEENLAYSYSGKKLKINSFTEILNQLRTKIYTVFPENEKVEFNCVLANLYRNGNDSNGWHADNEKELGKNPLIASLSFGESRIFDLKHNLSGEKLKFNLNHGSLIIMGGEFQHFWKHQIAKSKKIEKPRINLTFRKIIK